MVVYILHVKADLQGVASVAMSPGANLCISVRKPLSDDYAEVRENVVIDTSELVEAEKWERDAPAGSAPTHLDTHDREAPHHFALKWDGEKKRSTIRVLDGTATTEKAVPSSGKNHKAHKNNKGRHESDPLTREMRSQDSGEFVPMIALECEGIEPFAFHLMGGEFIVTRTSDGKTFDEIDLSQGDWNEFELTSGNTSVANFESKFV
jgi:hypothetical protein